MADPVTIFTALSVVGSVAGGVAESSSQMDEAARYESEARLADTQALQRDTQNRDELTRFLSTVQVARASNGLSPNSPNAYVLERAAIDQSDDDRLRQRADDRQRNLNYLSAAKSSRRSAKFSLVTGFTNAAVPLGEYASYKGYV